ncbi:hypothetical protein D9756_011319 [Leucocoprinus leucothites]|uniref:Indoleamine 2,3-dioxygenase n=1 Tax=Leucocoprinus leucothites TaxID=201217 RepID=A0A8H5CMR0_9AGAR|nr:hypothetical protein D9756_011319 [Leucoagaricus leucothites]
MPKTTTFNTLRAPAEAVGHCSHALPVPHGMSSTRPPFRLITYTLATMDGSGNLNVLVTTSVELVRQVEDLIQKLESLTVFPWDVSPPHKENWIVLDKFLHAGFQVCVASLQMSHQILKYLSSTTQADVEDNPRAMSTLGAIVGMVSVARVFNRALLEVKLESPPDQRGLWRVNPLSENSGLSDGEWWGIVTREPVKAQEYWDGFENAYPPQAATSLVNAAYSFDDNWRLALSSENTDILDSAKEQIINLFREHAVRVQIYANELRKYYQDTVHTPAIFKLWNSEVEYSPGSQLAVVLLESYLSNPPWNLDYRFREYLFGPNVIHGLNHIRSCSLTDAPANTCVRVLIRDTPYKMNTIALIYMRFLEQMRVSFLSTLAIEKKLGYMQTAGCYQLLQDPALTLSSMVQNQEIIRNATTEARATVGSLLSFLQEEANRIDSAL